MPLRFSINLLNLFLMQQGVPVILPVSIDTVITNWFEFQIDEFANDFNEWSVIVVTERPNHAKEIATSLDLKSYDAIVTASGDGTIHEIVNGLLSRHDASEIDIPIGPIPAGKRIFFWNIHHNNDAFGIFIGSGNALSTCLLGNDLGVSVPHAALNIIKGKLNCMIVYPRSIVWD